VVKIQDKSTFAPGSPNPGLRWDAVLPVVPPELALIIGEGGAGNFGRASHGSCVWVSLRRRSTIPLYVYSRKYPQKKEKKNLPG